MHPPLWPSPSWDYCYKPSQCHCPATERRLRASGPLLTSCSMRAINKWITGGAVCAITEELFDVQARVVDSSPSPLLTIRSVDCCGYILTSGDLSRPWSKACAGCTRISHMLTKRVNRCAEPVSFTTAVGTTSVSAKAARTTTRTSYLDTTASAASAFL